MTAPATPALEGSRIPTPLPARTPTPVPALGHRCPGLDANAHWDEPAALRGDILVQDQLAAHAAELARAHGKPARVAATGRLRRRFALVRHQIRDAYSVLTERMKAGRDPSPAEEWLIENCHVIEDQIREIHEDLPRGYLLELPRLAHGSLRGCPRVYALCLDYLRHTDGRLELGTLCEYVDAYQTVEVLTIGELWAVPIMLRLGLLLTVGALATSEAMSGMRERADLWAERLLSARRDARSLGSVLVTLERTEGAPEAPFLVQLSRRLREHDDAQLSVAFDWLAMQSEALGASPQELARVQHLKQAADRVSVGNAVTSMRAVGALAWNAFFERTSAVEALLRQDPLGVYSATDPETRDRYRHALEKIGRRVKVGELGVARAALAMAEAAGAVSPEETRTSHVGYYLVDAGRRALERRVGYRPPLLERMRRAVLTHPGFFYFGATSSLTLAGIAAVVLAPALGSPPSSPWWLVGFALLAALPASEVAMALTQAAVTTFLRPKLLPRLDLEHGVPEELRTLVVVPCLLDSHATVGTLLEELEVRSLANGDQNLHFALLTDFTDAETAECEADQELLEAAVSGIRQLNARHAVGSERFWLLHRRRTWNAGEGRFIGWERKRGKLEELNRLLRGAQDTTFSRILAPHALFAKVRFVLTLDADTDLPRDTARDLVAALGHPLNRPELNAARTRVVRGYGIVQPRVGASPVSARQSRFAVLASGPAGIDPYTTAVSDVYQDLFAEGSYTGKAIYDVDAFSAALRGRAPENILLSHDLFESFFARSALVTDIELLDEQPVSYEVHAERQHRWIRGDWQLVSWLFPRVPGRDGARRSNDLRLLDRFKLADNLRRSLLPANLVLMLAAALLLEGRASLALGVLFAAVLLTPLLARTVLAVTREASRVSGSPFSGFTSSVGLGVLRVAVDVLFLLDQALLSLDAIGTALYRLASRRHRLQWVTHRQTSRGKRGRSRARLLTGAALALAGGMALLLAAPHAAPAALPFVAAWALAPLVAGWLARPLSARVNDAPLPAADSRFLRLIARKTWRYFAHFVSERDHFLPPDNYQEAPRGVIAHRTSPTNIGLYLLSALGAHDLGIITRAELVQRLDRTLGTLETLPRRDGHLLNWYDTETLKPLAPEYVSTVDSGNLVAYLWTIASAPLDLRRAPLAGPAPLLAILDALELSQASLVPEPGSVLESVLRDLMGTLRQASEGSEPRAAQLLEQLEAAHTSLVTACAVALEQPLEVRYWLGEAERTARSWIEELGRLLPFVSVLRDLPPALEAELGEAYRSVRGLLLGATDLDALLTACDAARQLLGAIPTTAPARSAGGHLLAILEHAVQATAQACSQCLAELERVADRCRALADGMSFRFLFNAERELFATGFNLSTARLDGSHYDLLASEARLASLVAIAKGDVPQKHWFRLARPRARVDSSQSLLSWSGSMFEYLMPLLVTESQPRTLLDETMHAAVARQRSYAASHGVPWGISESAYNVMDLEMTYQYRAFGVPGLGLRAGLGEDLVVTPYATALAALVDSAAAVKNLRALERAGLSGGFGFFEAIDYSPQRLPPGKRAVVVRSFMAHHLGMTLVALDNVLHERIMQRRFHTDPRIKASALLLEERIPAGAPLVEVPPAAVAVPMPHLDDLDAMERVRFEQDMLPRVHLLGHGELATLVSVTGSGVLTWKGIDINRYREDSVFDAGGIYAYVRKVGQREPWSAGYHPTRRSADTYEAAFAIDRVELHRHDGALETITELAPSAEHAAEVRRFTLRNHGAEAMDVELTTFTELALAPRNADHAHRAFVGLFVETEFVAEHGAVLAHRRPREPGEPGIWVAQVLTPEDGEFGPLDYETSRPAFLGREGSLERPRAFADEDTPLGKATGAVLDAALALRRRVALAPGATARVMLATLMAETREELLHLVAIYAAPQASARTFELAWADARVELRHLGLTAAQVHSFQRLLSAIVHPLVGLRAPVEVGSLASGGISALWSSGISGDLPIVVLRLDHADFGELLRELLLSHAYFRVNGVTLDVVILNEEPAGYLQPLHDQALDIIRATHSEPFLNQRGGIFLRRADQIAEGERQLLLAAARAVLLASRGSLSRQLKRAARRAPLPAPLVLTQKPRRRPAPAPAAKPPLLFENGLGGFTADGREYVMTLEPGQHPPAPWCNVMANPTFGCVVSESGSCFAFGSNSQRHRLTPWSNDALLDPSGAVIYLRDDQDGSVWSATPAPASSASAHRVVHGQGYSRFSHTEHGIKSELMVFVPPDRAVVVQRLRIENKDSVPRTLSLYGSVEWVLGTDRDASRLTVVTEWDASAGALFAMNPLTFGPLATSFYASTGRVVSFTASREEFFGRPGSRRWPQALRRPDLAGQKGVGLDPCAALQVRVTLEPGKTFETSFVLGHAATRAEATQLLGTLSDARAVEQAFRQTVDHWDGVLSAISIRTPDPSLDVLMNRWLLYQALSCRIWGRSGFYQSSGAFGFRDQLQDVLCLLNTVPKVAREHLLVAAARQFSEGDVQHWWHRERGDGVRTRCSDDMLWLPYAAVEYTRVTGDSAILDEEVPFLLERPLAVGEHDLYSTPGRSPDTAPLYEHCARAIDSALAVGAHGLPKIGSGDWNDGMSRIGAGDEGESVWLGWFLVKVIHDFAPLARARGDLGRAATWLGHAERVVQALEVHGWDGRWYRRAFFDDGTLVGSHQSEECRIDAIAQSWAVISGSGHRHRARQAVLESERLLVREDGGLMCLLDPAFSGGSPDPGYIASYPAGIRENGGQYTHGVLWTLRALAELGETERAQRLLDLLNPIRHGDSAEAVARYRVEPYVVAADVYSAPGQVGRGGWTWYTGSAAWFYRIVLEDLLGFKRTGDVVTVSPCIPADWPGFELTYSYGRSALHLIVENVPETRTGPVRLASNGADESRITLVDDGQTHVVRVRVAGRSPRRGGAKPAARDSGAGELPPSDPVDEASWESFPASDPPALSREGS